MTHRRMRDGVTLAMVLIVAIVATMIWANSYSMFQSQVKLQERARHGYSGGVPDHGAAAAWAIACLRVAPPAASGTPPTARCTLTLGSGTNERKFGILYIDRGVGGPGGTVWEIEVTTGDPGWSACTSCPGAGGY
jgi:hypothetical protein